MDNYASIDDVKLVLGEETLDSFTTERVDFFLGTTKAVLDGLIGDLTEHNVTEKVYWCDIDKGGRFFIDSYNITAIVSIDGNTYSGVENTDYYIDRRQVYIGNL